MKPIQITHAYCLELKREVTITEARREYMCLPEGTPRFRFICSMNACWDESLESGVVIAGVNYDSLAEEAEKFVTAHFKRTKKGVHRVGCLWTCIEPAADVHTTDVDERAVRTARQKVTDLVTVFDPRVKSQNNHQNNPDLKESDKKTLAENFANHAFNTSRVPAISGETRTSDLQRLVDSYLEAKVRLTENEFERLPLKLVGQRRTTYKHYFSHIKSGHHTGVMYGDAVHIGDFGEGFKLRFLDLRNSLKIILYISKTQMNAYVHAKYLRKIVDELKKTRSYVTVYALGTLSQVTHSQTQQFELHVADLNYLALVLGANPNPKPNSE
jgi:hypothetical protein